MSTVAGEEVVCAGVAGVAVGFGEGVDVVWGVDAEFWVGAAEGVGVEVGVGAVVDVGLVADVGVGGVGAGVGEVSVTVDCEVAFDNVCPTVDSSNRTVVTICVWRTGLKIK